MPKRFPFPIHPAGWPFIAGFGVASLVLFFLATWLGWLGLALTVCCALFFRDPDRVVPLGASLVVSPADGQVLPIVELPPPPELGLGTEPRARVSIFMDLLDVHVNRAPAAGIVRETVYRPGRYHPASREEASRENEHLAMAMTLDADGRDIAVVQVAGLVARRIRSDVRSGDRLATGERFGIIRFGSRVDVYLPPGVAPLVAAGQRTMAGETVIADLEGGPLPRVGVVR